MSSAGTGGLKMERTDNEKKTIVGLILEKSGGLLAKAQLVFSIMTYIFIIPDLYWYSQEKHISISQLLIVSCTFLSHYDQT